MSGDPWGKAPAADPFSDPAVQQQASFSANFDTYDAEAQQPPQQEEQNAPQQASSYDSNSSPDWAERGDGQPAAPQGKSDRELELERREKAVAERERQLAQTLSGITSSGRVKNWPLPFWKIAYHDISSEIPIPFQKTVRRLYGLLWFTWLGLLWNFVTLAYIWGADLQSDADTDLLWSAFFLFLGVPGAWRLWYRSIYFAIRDNKARKWISFFLYFAGHLAFSGIVAAGVPGIPGTSGLLIFLKLLAGGDTAAAMCCLVTTILFGLNAFATLTMLKVAHSKWKGNGGQSQLQGQVASAAVSHAIASQSANKDAGRRNNNAKSQQGGGDQNSEDPWA